MFPGTKLRCVAPHADSDLFLSYKCVMDPGWLLQNTLLLGHTLLQWHVAVASLSGSSRVLQKVSQLHLWVSQLVFVTHFAGTFCLWVTLTNKIAFPATQREFLFFFLGTHCLDRIAPLIDLTLMFPIKSFVCVVSLSRQHKLMTISPPHSWTDWLVGGRGLWWKGLQRSVFPNTSATPFFF